jgi:hypothetical protein
MLREARVTLLPTRTALRSEDPILRDTKLIAEAWDCDGLNQARRPRS